MRVAHFLLVLAAVASLAGCAWTKSASLPFKQESGGSLSVWNADMSAALAYPNGQMCMQRALALKTIDGSASLKISEAVLALAETAKTTAVNGSSGDLLTVVATLRETATLLTTTTERTAFLDLGMFYVCQMSANGTLTDRQTAEAVRVIAIAASNISGGPASQIVIDAIKNEMPDGINTNEPKPSQPTKPADQPTKPASSPASQAN